MSLRAISYGGGVQSTALLVLAANRLIDYPLAIFANVGDDSEHPATLAYVNEVAKPYAAANGIELVEVRRDETLYQRLHRERRSVSIPARLEGSGAPGNRSCTGDFKIKVIAKELKRRGATASDPATVALGISIDEFHRMRGDSGIAYERLEYPLIERRLHRGACAALITRAGLPVPPKSSCYFCPFKTRADWKRLRRETPDLFAKAVALETVISERHRSLGRGGCFLSRTLRPLDEAITDDGQLSYFDDGATCDVGGYCHA